MLLTNNCMAKHLIVFSLVILLVTENTFAGRPYRKSELDSVKKVEVLKRKAQADAIRKNIVYVHFSADYADSLLAQMEQFHIALNNITNQTRYSFKTKQIEGELQYMQSAIDIITQNVTRDSSVVSISSLQMYRGLLTDMQQQLQAWKDELEDDNDQLQDMTDQMTAFVRDSFTQKVAADSAFANLHLDEMLILNERWKEAKNTTGNNLDRINKLQAGVSTAYFDVVELENKTSNLLTGSGKKAFSQEYSYIWNSSRPPLDEVFVVTQQSLQDRYRILKYYLSLNVSCWMYFLFAGVIFFFWVLRNFSRIKKNASAQYQKDLQFKYIHPLPVLSTIILIMGLAPYYGLNQPAVYIQVIYLLLLIPLTIRFRALWPRKPFVYWCVLVLLFVLTYCVNAIVTPGWPLRILLLSLNSVSVIWGCLALRNSRDPAQGRVIKISIILYIMFNLAAIIANTTGRLTIAKTLSAGAETGLVQITGLLALIQILVEAFYLQMQSSRMANGMSVNFNFSKIRAELEQLLTTAAVILGIIIFITNIDLYYAGAEIFDHIFNTPRKIGSTSFTLGNLAAFGLILYFVSILQKYVGYFFGETDEDFIGDLDKKESRLVLFRLLIIMVGFFMAVVASGLPVDKVTVVLGALGVGIGLGLQNIVFNLVSGVILIFEKPMQIGDYIEVGDKKGRVQNIGIRSSKLVTPDGSEVIVPNGDILSSHMVNWTRSNNHRRAELVFSIQPSSQLQVARDTIVELMKANNFVIQGEPVEILVNTLSEDSATLTVNVWINSIYKEQEFKSEVLSGIYNKLSAKGIKIV